MASTTGRRPEARVVEQLVDGLAQERDARDDEGADEEDEEQQGAEHEGLHDGPGLALARAGVAAADVQRAGRDRADAPHRREGDRGDVEERVTRRGCAAPRRAATEPTTKRDGDDDATPRPRLGRVAVLPAHRLEQGGVEEGAQLGHGSSHVLLLGSGSSGRIGLSVGRARSGPGSPCARRRGRRPAGDTPRRTRCRASTARGPRHPAGARSSGTQRRTYSPSGSNFFPWVTGLKTRK